MRMETKIGNRRPYLFNAQTIFTKPTGMVAPISPLAKRGQVVIITGMEWESNIAKPCPFFTSGDILSMCVLLCA